MYEQCLYFNTIKFSRQINALWDEAFRPINLSPSHAYSLRFIIENPGITPKKLAEKMELNLSTISRFIDRLSQKGLVLRRKRSKDKRESSLYPSKKATELKSKLDMISSQLYSKIRDLLGTEDVDEIISMMKNFSLEINDDSNSKK